MLRNACFTLFGALSFALSACTTTKAPHVDAQLGQATRSLFAQQIEHPEASKNTAVPVGMAAEAVSGLNNYHRSFSAKAGDGPVVASGGNSSGGGGDGGGDWAGDPARNGRFPASDPSTMNGQPLPPLGAPPGVSQSYFGTNGTYYQGVAGGVVNTTNGQFSQDVGPGVVNSVNGQFTPKP